MVGFGNGGSFGPPQVDFYSMLSGLGDTLQRNALVQKQQQLDEARKAAFSSLDPNSADFGKVAMTGALGLLKAGDISGGTHLLTLAQAQNERDHQHSREAVTDSHWEADHKIAAARAAREQADFDNTPDQYKPNPKAGQPGEPDFIDQYAAATAASQSGKPVPFETLAGTKFMVRQPSGSYSIVDPNAIANGNPGGSAPPVAPPAVPSAAPATGPQPAVPAPAVAQPGAPAVPQAPAPGAGQPSAPEAPQVAQPATPAAPAAPIDVTAIDPNTGRRENWLKSQSPDVQAYIKKIADYEIDPRTTSIKGGHREQVLSAVAQYDPTYDQNTFGQRAKAMKDFGTGPQGNSIRSFDVGISHLDTLQKYVAALDSGNIRLVNEIRNSWLKETGSALPTNVQAVAPIVGAEVSKAIIGSNNALADREELRKPLQIANSPDQIIGAAGAYKNLMAGQLQGLKKQYEDTTGKKNFDSRIREDTRKVLLGGENGPGGSAAQPNVTSTGVKWSIQ